MEYYEFFNNYGTEKEEFYFRAALAYLILVLTKAVKTNTNVPLGIIFNAKLQHKFPSLRIN